MSTLGETAGKDAVATQPELLFDCDLSPCSDLSLSGQTQGLGTSLKILFSGRQIKALPVSGVQRPAFQLSRQEIVSLFNGFGR